MLQEKGQVIHITFALIVLFVCHLHNIFKNLVVIQFTHDTQITISRNIEPCLL